MADKELEYRVKVDANQAERELREFGRAAERAGRDVKDAFDDTASAGDKARAAIVAMAEASDAELRSAAAAADALKASLGEMADRVDVDQVVTDLNRMGVTFDEIRADADQFADTLRRVDGIRVQQVNDGLENTRRHLDDVRSSGDQSRSVLANLAGNAAQDLGELGGVVGSLGVGIGQLAEYAVDGNIAMSNLAKVAGPLLGLSAALAAVGVVTGENQKRQKQYNDTVDAFADALEDAGGSAEAVNEALTANKELFEGISTLGWEQTLISKLPVLNRMADDLTLSMEENIAALAKSGVTVTDWSTALAASDAERTAFIQSLKDMADAGLITQDEFASLSVTFGNHRAALEDATRGTEDWARVSRSTIEGVNQAMGDLADQQQHTAELWDVVLGDLADGAAQSDDAVAAWSRLKDILELTDEEMAALADQKLNEQLAADAEAAAATAERLRELRDEAQATAKGISEAQRIMSSGEWRNADMEGATAAYERFRDAVTGDRQLVSDTEEAWDGLADAVEGAGDHLLDLQTPEGRAVFDALDELANTIMPDLSQAFAAADGDFGTFQRAADSIANDTLRRLQDEFNLSEEDAEDMRAELGLMPDQLRTFYELAGDEEARVQLGLLQGAIDALPEDVQLRVTQKIIAGDYRGAVAEVQNYLNANPGRVRVNTEMGSDKAFRNSLADQIYTVSVQPRLAARGGGGGSIDRGRSLERVAPAAAAPAAAAAPVVVQTMPSVTIQTAVVGSRYSVQRAVAQALRGYTRINGR